MYCWKIVSELALNKICNKKCRHCRKLLADTIFKRVAFGPILSFTYKRFWQWCLTVLYVQCTLYILTFFPLFYYNNIFFCVRIKHKHSKYIFLDKLLKDKNLKSNWKPRFFVTTFPLSLFVFLFIASCLCKHCTLYTSILF